MPRLTNAKVHALAIEYRAARAREKAEKGDADALRDQLLDQLRLRKRTELVVDGVTITRKAKRTRIYAAEQLRKILPRRLVAEVLPPTVKVTALDAAVKAGHLAQADVDGCLAETMESAPYIDVRINTTEK